MSEPTLAAAAAGGATAAPDQASAGLPLPRPQASRLPSDADAWLRWAEETLPDPAGPAVEAPIQPAPPASGPPPSPVVPLSGTGREARPAGARPSAVRRGSPPPARRVGLIGALAATAVAAAVAVGVTMASAARPLGNRALEGPTSLPAPSAPQRPPGAASTVGGPTSAATGSAAADVALTAGPVSVSVHALELSPLAPRRVVVLRNGGASPASWRLESGAGLSVVPAGGELEPHQLAWVSVGLPDASISPGAATLSLTVDGARVEIPVQVSP